MGWWGRGRAGGPLAGCETRGSRWPPRPGLLSACLPGSRAPVSYRLERTPTTPSQDPEREILARPSGSRTPIKPSSQTKSPRPPTPILVHSGPLDGTETGPSPLPRHHPPQKGIRTSSQPRPDPPGPSPGTQTRATGILWIVGEGPEGISTARTPPPPPHLSRSLGPTPPWTAGVESQKPRRVAFLRIVYPPGDVPTPPGVPRCGLGGFWEGQGSPLATAAGGERRPPGRHYVQGVDPGRSPIRYFHVCRQGEATLRGPSPQRGLTFRDRRLRTPRVAEGVSGGGAGPSRPANASLRVETGSPVRPRGREIETPPCRYSQLTSPTTSPTSPPPPPGAGKAQGRPVSPPAHHH